MKVCLDPGHFKGYGNSSPDKTLFEFEFNQDIVDLTEKILQQYNIIVIKTKNMNDPDVSLKERANIANRANADLFISIHTNAHMTGVWTEASGFEVFHYPNSSTSNKLANMIHNHAIPYLSIKDRGVKQANFAVLRHTNMSAILIEYAFMTCKSDCNLLKSQEFRQKCAEVIVLTVLEWFNIQPKINTQTVDNIYKLFSQNKIQFKTINKNEAYSKGWELYNIGVNDVILITPENFQYTFDNHQNENPCKVKDKGKLTILGKSELTFEQLDTYIKKVNPNAPDLVDYYIEYGEELGIRGDIALCQAIKETGWFKFGGIVKSEYNNYCGLILSGKAIEFTTPRRGVLAHLQHLHAYACKDSLPNNQEIIDPKFNDVQKGTAPYWQDLDGKWAINDNYCEDILKIYNQIKNTKINSSAKRVEDGSEKNNKYKTNETENVFYTVTNIDNKQLISCVIDDKGYIGVSDIAKLFNYKAIWDKDTKEIILVKEDK